MWESDKAPEGLVEKVTADDVNIGLSYVCVRNRIGEESYKEARVEEVRLFESHPLLSKIDKSIVGISILAQNLMRIQAASIARNLPATVKTERFELGLCITMVESEREQKLSNSEIVFSKLSTIQDTLDSIYIHYKLGKVLENPS